MSSEIAEGESFGGKDEVTDHLMGESVGDYGISSETEEVVDHNKVVSMDRDVDRTTMQSPPPIVYPDFMPWDIDMSSDFDDDKDDGSKEPVSWYPDEDDFEEDLTLLDTTAIVSSKTTPSSAAKEEEGLSDDNPSSPATDRMHVDAGRQGTDEHSLSSVAAAKDLEAVDESEVFSQGSVTRPSARTSIDNLDSVEDTSESTMATKERIEGASKLQSRIDQEDSQVELSVVGDSELGSSVTAFGALDKDIDNSTIPEVQPGDVALKGEEPTSTDDSAPNNGVPMEPPDDSPKLVAPAIDKEPFQESTMQEKRKSIKEPPSDRRPEILSMQQTHDDMYGSSFEEYLDADDGADWDAIFASSEKRTQPQRESKAPSSRVQKVATSATTPSSHNDGSLKEPDFPGVDAPEGEIEFAKLLVSNSQSVPSSNENEEALETVLSVPSADPTEPDLGVVDAEVASPPIAGDSAAISEPTKDTERYSNVSNVSSFDREFPPYEAMGGIEGRRAELDDLQEKIHKLHGKPFNINSPRQVSTALFGVPNQSTSQDALESSCAGTSQREIAQLIIQFRKLNSFIKRMEKRSKSQEDGTYVHTLHRTQPAPETLDAPVATLAEPTIDNEPLLLVDTSTFIFRAYHSMPPLHRSDGTPTGAVRGFCSMIFKLLKEPLLRKNRPRLVLVLDAKGKTFRHDMYPEYKANRPECPMDLVPQFDLVKEAAQAFGLPQIEASSFEADDVIATLAHMASRDGISTRILSADKDLMQLVTPMGCIPSVDMVDPKTMIKTDHDGVVQKLGVVPNLVGDMLALVGDSSDNVPGVKGIGKVGAAKLLNQFGSLDGILSNINSVKAKGQRKNLEQGVDMAKLSRELVELETNIPIESMTWPKEAERVGDLRMAPFEADRLSDFYTKMEFKNLDIRLKDWMADVEKREQKFSRAKIRPSLRRKATVPQPGDWDDDLPF